MPLTGQQIKLIQQALCEGFPTRDHLAMMLRLETDIPLYVVPEAGDHLLRVFNLITWAESQGKVRMLITAAAAQNGGNPQVKQLVAASRTWQLDGEADAAAATPALVQATAPVGDAHSKYPDHLYTRYRFLDFKGMGMADRVPLQLPIEQMYVPLKARVEMPKGETWARDLLLAGRSVTEEEAAAMGERLSEPLPLLDLLQKHAGLVILGDPGAGKTTFVKYLTVMLASGQGAALGLEGRLPVLVPLSAYANALAQHDLSLHEFVANYLHTLGVDVPVGPLLQHALEHGQALVMLDGLDEVQTAQQRALVVQRVETFFDYHRKAGNKFIITSRVVGYRDARLAAEGLQECTLVDFEYDDIVSFLAKWTQAIEQAAKGDSTITQVAAAEEKAEMLTALERNPGVAQLAANPLLLTILALMKRQGVLLPERRVQLYEQYVQTLLRHWNLARGLDKRAARNLDVLATTRVLAPLALWMQETSPGAGLVKRGDLLRRLQTIYTERGAADPEQAAAQFLRDVRDHAGLLLERGPGQYGFIHLTFQEYLAAMAVAQNGQSDLAPVVDLLAARLPDPRWHEVLLLTIGYLGIVQQRDEAAGEVLMRLIERAPGEPGAAVVLAGEAVTDVGLGGVTSPARAAIVDALLSTIQDDRIVKAVVRSRSGSLLGLLGDPRVAITDALHMEFCLVSPGPFAMGEGGEQRPYDVSYAYWIGRYPVTVAQFAQFVAAGGYAEAKFWPEAQQAGLWQQGCFRARRRPRQYGEPFDLSNHPVVGVSWYEALAFVRWLNEASGLPPDSLHLPSEPEWEKAARGGSNIVAEPVIAQLQEIAGTPSFAALQPNVQAKRTYPWGDEPNPECANYADTKIGSTNAVGCFRRGASPYGVEEMSGNVWEWTRSVYAGYPYPPGGSKLAQRENLAAGSNEARVLRGSAFYLNVSGVSCAARSGDVSLYDRRYIGFRLVLYPFPPGR